jgi:hypothetical protein
VDQNDSDVIISAVVRIGPQHCRDEFVQRPTRIVAG